MSKIVVETTGNFILQDITNGAVIEAEGATEVEKTGFVDAQIEKGTLKESSEKPAPKAEVPKEEDVPTGTQRSNTTKK